MLLKIKYFGLLSEVTGCNEETINFEGKSISELLDFLYKNYIGLKDKDFQVAQNRQLVSAEEDLTANEIVLLPPFAGG